MGLLLQDEAVGGVEGSEEALEYLLGGLHLGGPSVLREECRVERLHRPVDGAPGRQRRPGAPVDAVAQRHHRAVLPGHHGEGVGDGRSGVLGRVRVALVQGDGLAGGGVVGPVPVAHGGDRGLAVVAQVALQSAGQQVAAQRGVLRC